MNKLLYGLMAGLTALLASHVYAAPATLSDAEIVSVVQTANTGEIKQGQYVQSHADNTEVKEFAKMMVTDHTTMNDSAKALAQKQGMKPQFNAVSKSLKDDSDKSMKKLKGLNGAELDKAYIDSQVQAHQSVLDTIDNTLMPSVKGQELKDALAQSRSKVAEHLEHAKKLQTSTSH